VGSSNDTRAPILTFGSESQATKPFVSTTLELYGFIIYVVEFAQREEYHSMNFCWLFTDPLCQFNIQVFMILSRRYWILVHILKTQCQSRLAFVRERLVGPVSISLPQAGRPPALPVFLESGWPPLPRSSVPEWTTTVRCATVSKLIVSRKESRILRR